MIRVLVIIAVTGFLVSVVCITAAVGIAGPDAIAQGGWNFGPEAHWWIDHSYEGWGFHHHHHEDRDDADDQDSGGPRTTREIAWSGGDTLSLDLPADVKYVQAAGPAKVVVTGPRDDVADVEVDGGQIRFNRDRWRDNDLSIVVSAPSVTRFEMSGSGKLAITDYKQDKLSLELTGDSDVTAKGEAKAIDLSIAGSADAELGEVKARSATVNIEGSGEATLAPAEAAKVDISGSGEVTLLTRPPALETNISGSGSLRQGQPRSAETAPAPRTAKKRAQS